MEFFIVLFESLGLYSTQGGLAEHLRGLRELNGEVDFTGQSIYNIVFISLISINSLIIFNYYYGIFNRRPFNRWWWWLINVIVGAVILFLIAFIYPNNDLQTGSYYKELVMTTSDCSGFGLTAAIYSFIWCCILSLLIKWKSSVNKKVPF